MPIENKLLDIENEINFIITARINKFVQLVNAEIRGRLSFTRIVNDFDTLVKFKTKIPSLYRKAKLDSITNDIAARFPDIAKETIEDAAEKLGVSTLQAGKITKPGRTILRETLKNVRSVERANSRRFRRVLKTKALKNISRSEFLELIKDTAAKSKAQLQTVVSTSVQGFDNVVSTVKANAAGANKFRYAGATGGDIRPFCEARVGGVFTDAESKTWNNGQGLDASIYLGGYNCRHRKEYIID
jgi:hypothetical protein